MSLPTPDEVNSLETTLQTLSQRALQDEPSRKRLLAILQEQTRVLESPDEVIWRLMMEPHQSSALRIALAMGLIPPIASSKDGITATTLSEITKCDRELIIRILRPLASLKIIHNPLPQLYLPTPTTQILLTPLAGGFKFMFDLAGHAVFHLPTYLQSTSFEIPQGSTGNFQSCFNTKLPMFPYLMSHPEHMCNFNDLMMAPLMERAAWFDVCDVEKILFETDDTFSKPHDIPDTGASKEMLLVDIGGNRGQDLQAFKKRFENEGRKLDGRLVLQDLPPVIGDIEELDEGIVRMGYDFFTPQPIIGAKSYYLRYILHDHPNPICHQILTQIKAAMKPNHSKLLIFEYILPETGCELYPALLDINMLALLNGLERTESQWRDLLEGVGLSVVRFWKGQNGGEGVVEAVLKG